MKRIASLISVLLLSMTLVACGGSNEPNPVVSVETSLGTFEAEIYQNEVPEMAKNFLELVKQGKYDNTPFHRVVNQPEPFVIQGGDFTNKNGTGGHSYKGPGTTLPGEFDDAISSNTRGTLSYANRGPDTNGSQFFVNLKDNLPLDHDKQPLTSQHPVFGKVVAGMDVVDAIGAVEVENQKPVEDVLLIKASIKEVVAEESAE